MRAPLRGPLQSAYSAIAAVALGSALHLLRSSCRFTFEHESLIRSRDPHICCFWHRDIFSFFPSVAGDGVRRVSFIHPAWYIAPWFRIGRELGWKMAVGSTGHRGREAADEIVAHLRQGYSTFICPDGPAGPPRVLKRGVLHIARQSGAPIIPLRFRPSHPVILPSWDGKRVPRPFSTVHVSCGPALHVADQPLDAAADQLTSLLG